MRATASFHTDFRKVSMTDNGPESVIIARRGKGGGTLAHPYIAINFLLDSDPRVLMWLMDIASQSSSPAGVCNQLITRLKIEGPYQTESSANYLYLIRKGNSNDYKIGISKNPDDRLGALQTSSADKLNLVAYCAHNNAYEVEKAIHNILKDCRITGEWFNLDEEMLVYLLREYYGATI